MRQREQLILTALESSAYITSHQLAKKLGVSHKTIQKDMLYLTAFVADKGASIQAKTGQGYQLTIHDASRYREAVREVVAPAIETVEERRTYLLDQLLTLPYVKLSQMETVLYVSKKTLSNDLVALRKRLAPYRLGIEKRPHYGIYLTGSERHVRSFMAVTEGLSLYTFSVAERADLGAFLKGVGLSNDFDQQKIVTLIQIALTRLSRGYRFPNDGSDDSSELMALSDRYGWQLTSSEVSVLWAHIESFLLDRSHSRRDSYQGAIKEGLGIVQETFGIDLSHDESFLTHLTDHVQKLGERLQTGIVLKNPLLSDIKSNLNSEFVMATLLARILERDWGILVPEDEIGFLSLIFATSASKIDDLKKHLLVICLEGDSGRDFLKTSYERLFGRYVHQVSVSSPQAISGQDLSQYDCIVSTVRLPELEAYHPHYVPYFLEEGDKQVIKSKLSVAETTFVDNLLDEVIFLSGISGQTKEGVVTEICQAVTQRIGLDLTSKVLDRLAMGVTQLGHQVVFLHPQGRVNQHFISVTVLDEPVYWEHSAVRIICLVSLPSINTVSKLLYQMLSTLMIERVYVNQLLQEPSEQTLLGILQKIKERELMTDVY